MYSPSVIFGLYVLGIAASSSGGVGHCDTIAFEPGISYSWIIPPRSQSSSNDGRPSSSSLPDRPYVDFDIRNNESPITPVGGFGHPPFYLRHSHEQLSLPNEFLITPTDPRHQRNGGPSHQPPLFQQLDPVDCDGDPTCTNVDITQQQQRQRATTMHRSNIDAVPSIPPSSPSDDYLQQRGSVPVSLGQPVSWPSSHNGGIGLLFFIPESASHLPVEQLIRQQLALHRTQFPFDISINCEENAAGTGCLPGGRLSQPLTSFAPPPPATTLNGRNVENGNYASLPLFEIVNSSSQQRRRGNQDQQQQQQQQRKWRTIGERIARNKQQHRNRLQQQQFEQQELQQQQWQQELSILP